MFYDDIYHYGIPGQRHGRRRFQNRDGSLTPAGRAGYLKGRTPSSSGSTPQIKRPSDSNKNGTTSGSTKQNRGLSKNAQERTRYLTEREETLNALDQWGKQSLLSLARREGYDVANVNPDSLIKNHGTNSYSQFMQSVNNMIDRMGLGDVNISAFTIDDSMGTRYVHKRVQRG